MNDNYDEIINWLFEQVPMFQNIGAGAYKPGLDRTLQLSAAFGSPHSKLRAIHIAGTNGKGSTASTLAAILSAAGYRTALYTSPHLVDFRERIRIDGQMIPRSEVINFISKFRQLCPNLEPSFFELTTIMAFDWFARNNVDYAVIEVGLGGRLDSTNIISPLLSVITNISLDHTALLGSTPAAIASEKAGIIKPEIPVVIGRADGDVRSVFANRALECNSPICFAQDNLAYTKAVRSDDAILYLGTKWGDIKSELTGDCQLENANTIFHALNLLPFEVPVDAVAKGFENVSELTGLMGRWTTLGTNPRLICDTGHNPGGWEFLAPRLTKIAAESTLHIVIGFVSDKDVSSILSLLPHNAKYYFPTPSVKRGMQSSLLAEKAAEHGLVGPHFDSVADAVAAAKAVAGSSDVIFVGGSTFVVADLLNIS